MPPRYFHSHFVVNTTAIDTVFDAEWSCPFGNMVLDHVEVGSLDNVTAAVMIQHRRNGFGAVIGSGMIVGGLGMDNHFEVVPHLSLAQDDLVRVRILFPNAVSAVQIDMMMHKED